MQVSAKITLYVSCPYGKEPSCKIKEILRTTFEKNCSLKPNTNDRSNSSNRSNRSKNYRPYHCDNSSNSSKCSKKLK